MTWALTVGKALEIIDDTALAIIVILNILYVLILTFSKNLNKSFENFYHFFNSI
jgi:hypothetical protein